MHKNPDLGCEVGLELESLKKSSRIEKSPTEFYCLSPDSYRTHQRTPNNATAAEECSMHARTNGQTYVRTHARRFAQPSLMQTETVCFWGLLLLLSFYYYTPVSHVRSVRSLMRKCARSDQPAYAQGKARRLYNSDRQRERQGFSFSSTTAQNLEALTLHESACGCACRIPSQETYAQNQKA